MLKIVTIIFPWSIPPDLIGLSQRDLCELLERRSLQQGRVVRAMKCLGFPLHRLFLRYRFVFSDAMLVFMTCS